MAKTPVRVVNLLKREIPSKISRNKFCIKTGINQNSIDKYMAGVAEPTQASLEKLSEYFGKSVGWLRGDRFSFDFSDEPVALCAKCGNELPVSH